MSKAATWSPVLAALNSGGDRWLADEDGVPVVMHHEHCEHDAQAQVVLSMQAVLRAGRHGTAARLPSNFRRLLEEPAIQARFSLGSALLIERCAPSLAPAVAAILVTAAAAVRRQGSVPDLRLWLRRGDRLRRVPSGWRRSSVIVTDRAFVILLGVLSRTVWAGHRGGGRHCRGGGYAPGRRPRRCPPAL
ncbi:hypothetical protein HBB16_13610 [Pseudonocardia sp. MCCB 268]|nr:hypothetical protein [Pseudonocardia cytotoxica]